MDPSLLAKNKGIISGLLQTNVNQRRRKPLFHQPERFWDVQGVIITDFLEKRSTITWQHYCACLDKFNKLQERTSPFESDETPVLPRQCTISFVSSYKKKLQLHNELLPHHPPYSSDLATCKFFNPEKITRWKAVHVKYAGYHRNRGIL